MNGALHVVLCQPEIPPNTGSIIRLCANTGAALHLIEPLGFEFDDARLRRAGLDYREFTKVQIWQDFESYRGDHPDRRIIAIETSGPQSYSTFRYEGGDALVLTIPKSDQVLNLNVAVARVEGGGGGVGRVAPAKRQSQKAGSPPWAAEAPTPT